MANGYRSVCIRARPAPPSDTNIPREGSGETFAKRYNGRIRAQLLLDSKREGLEALCRKYAVRRLRLFGSGLRYEWDPAISDLDFLVEFGPPIGMNAFQRVTGLLLDLEALLGCRVDIVDWNAAQNPFFRAHAEKSANVLFAA